MEDMMRKFIVIFGCCLSLVGCETMQLQPQKSQAQIENERISSRTRAADAAYKVCSDEVKATGIQVRFYEEILYENENAANKFKLMTKNELPLQEQIEYLKETMPALTKCRTHIIDGYATTPFQTVALKYLNAQDEIYIKLMKSEITIGKANEDRSKIVAQQKIDWANAAAELDSRLRSMHESEMTGRRQTAAAMLPYLMQQQQNQQFQQQMFYQQQMQNIISNRPVMTAPTTTNCSSYGNQINCTTR